MASERRERTIWVVRFFAALAIYAFFVVPWSVQMGVFSICDGWSKTGFDLATDAAGNALARGLALPIEATNPAAWASITDELRVLFALGLVVGSGSAVFVPGRRMRARLLGSLGALTSATVLTLITHAPGTSDQIFEHPELLAIPVFGACVAALILVWPESAPFAGIMTSILAIFGQIIVIADREPIDLGPALAVLALGAAFWLECCRFDPEPPGDTSDVSA